MNQNLTREIERNYQIEKIQAEIKDLENKVTKLKAKLKSGEQLSIEEKAEVYTQNKKAIILVLSLDKSRLNFYVGAFHVSFLIYDISSISLNFGGLNLHKLCSLEEFISSTTYVCYK